MHPHRDIVRLLGIFVVTSMVGGVLAAGLALPVIGTSGLLAKSSVNYFESLPDELTVPPQAERSRLLAADGSLITTFFDENRDVKNLEEISPFMRAAVVAIEDSRFYQHRGVDLRGMARAAMANQIAGRITQGASTLTQQYVKNVLIGAAVARGDPEAAKEARRKDAARKIQEIRYAAALEERLSKDTILQRYLNIVFFGRTLYGVQSAARYYFGITAKQLDLAQAATLAGMIQQPAMYSPQKHPEASVERRNIVLARMLELDLIDKAAYRAATAVPLKTKITKTPNGCANAQQQYGYYCEYVRRLIIGSKEFAALGRTAAERETALLRGGLTIKTALDPKIMNASWKALSKTVPPKDKSNVAAAGVTVEPGTGMVLAIQQNKTYGDGDRRSGFRSLNYAVDKEWGGGQGFPTGSTFKPFTLATWLDAGKSLKAVVRSSGGTVPFSSFTACGSPLKGGKYTYRNANEGRTGDARMTVWDGTAGSVNGVYISMEQKLDLCKIRKTAESLGVHLAAARDDVCDGGTARTTRLPTCVPSLTLGVASLSPMTMAAAYAAFAADGKFCEPTAVVQILDRSNASIRVPGAACRQGIDRQVARAVNLGLSRTLTNGTAANVGGLPDDRPASAKTGTTNDSIDTWFVGYTRQLATAVWVGDPFSYTRDGRAARRTLNRRTIGGEYHRVVYGSTLAAPIWKKIMAAASKGTKVKSFARPSASYVSSSKLNVPDGAEPDGGGRGGGGDSGGGGPARSTPPTPGPSTRPAPPTRPRPTVTRPPTADPAPTKPRPTVTRPPTADPAPTKPRPTVTRPPTTTPAPTRTRPPTPQNAAPASGSRAAPGGAG